MATNPARASDAPSPSGSTDRGQPLSDRQRAIQTHFDRIAPTRHQWIERNAYFYGRDWDYIRFLIPEGASVLEVGSGNGDLLAALAPSRGVGIDMSGEMVRVARERHPHLEFAQVNVERPGDIECLEGPFDFVLFADSIGHIDDCETTFRNIRRLCTAETRVVVAFYLRWWEPLLKLAARLGRKMPEREQNWLSTLDIGNLLRLADYESIRMERRELIPWRWLGIGTFINRYIAVLPFIRKLCLRRYVVARPTARPDTTSPSVTVLVPCRNERGNIESAATRLPDFGARTELLYVEGHSSDGTYEECLRVKEAHPELEIEVLRQPGKGKGDAVRTGFGAATGDILMILDADLTVPPEDLPKFYAALISGKGEFINGTRLVYPMHEQAMRVLNFIANRGFGMIFSYLLNQRFTDTLCGTKVLRRRDYEKIAANRAYFGDFDPFGDFDLIFGAARLNLKIIEVPIRYASRTYGETQISRFFDGWLLIRMVWFAWRKLKAF